MIHPAEFANADAACVAEKIRANQWSVTEVRETVEQLIHHLNPVLNAFVSADPDRTGTSGGRFRGVPMALKDCISFLPGDTRDYGSYLAQGSVVSSENEIINRYYKLGFQFCGVTNVPEFSCNVTTESRLHGAAQNPWKLGFSTGGSSGGAAAAVAAGIVPVAYGNDSIGSIRIPASCCGVFGFKPSRGRVPVGPAQTEFMSGLLVNHVLTRSVRDSAAILDATDHPEPGSAWVAPAKSRPYLVELTAPVSGLRARFTTRAPNDATVHPEVAAAVRCCIDVLADAGVDTREGEPVYDGPHVLQGVMDTFAIYLADDINATAARTGRCVEPGFVERCNLALARRGRQLSALDLYAIRRDWSQLSRQVGRFFETCDLFVTPTLATPPPPHGHINSNDEDLGHFLEALWSFSPFTPLANITGCPAMNVPVGWTSDGLPAGVMIMAPLGREDLLFRVAGFLEQAMPWGSRHPPHSAWNLPNSNP